MAAKGTTGWLRPPARRAVVAVTVAGLALVSVVVLGLRSAAERPGAADGHSTSAEPLRLGQPLPLTGESRSSGLAMQIAAQMAVAHANARGGVSGRPIELVTVDDACDPQTAVAAANALVRTGIAVSVGGYCSSATLPTVPIFQRAGVPMILPASNAEDLLDAAYEGLFLLIGTGTQEAVAALAWMGELGHRRVALVHDGTSYSANIATVAADRLTTRAAGTPARLSLATVQRVTQGALEHRRVAAAVQAGDADVVYFTGYTAEAGRLTRDLRRGGYRGDIMIADGGVDPAFLAFAEGTAEGVYATMPPLAQHLTLPAGWVSEFRERAGHDPGPFTVQAYDAVTLAVDALRRADDEGTDLAGSIRDTDGLALLTGPAKFAPDRTPDGFEFTLLQVRSGRFDRIS